MLAVAALYAADARWPHRRAEAPPRMSVRDALAPQAGLLGGGVLVTAAIAVVRPRAVIVYVRTHEVFMVGAVAIGVLALTVSSVIALAMRR